MHADIIIIGAGPAGLHAAKAAAKSGKKVVLAGEEPFLPYWRPRLPEIIVTGAEIDSILIQNALWYKQNGIEFLPSKKAVYINPDQKLVEWEDGSTTGYDSLILACGAYSNIPPVPFTDKVFPFRTYRDAQAIRKECARTQKAFIVGGGVLGLETAFAVVKAGYRAVVFDINDYPLSRQLDREGGLYLKKLIEEEEIIIRSGAALEDLKEDIEGACVIAAAGVRPAVNIIKECGMNTNRGIMVDDRMRTSVSGIYACGDIAEFSGQVPGLMAIATKQGETAGLNASGEDAVYTAVLPSPMMKVAGISVLSIGNIKTTPDSKVYQSFNGSDYAMAVVTSERLTGAAFIGNTALGMKFKKHMEAGTVIGNVSSFEDIIKAVE